MPLRINNMTSNVRVTGQEGQLSQDEINRIVNIVLTQVNEELAHRDRVLDETKIRDSVSEVEPY